MKKNGLEEAIAKHGSRFKDQFMPGRVGLLRDDKRARQEKQTKGFMLNV